MNEAVIAARDDGGQSAATMVIVIHHATTIRPPLPATADWHAVGAIGEAAQAVCDGRWMLGADGIRRRRRQRLHGPHSMIILDQLRDHGADHHPFVRSERPVPGRRSRHRHRRAGRDTRRERRGAAGDERPPHRLQPVQLPRYEARADGLRGHRRPGTRDAHDPVRRSLLLEARRPHALPIGHTLYAASSGATRSRSLHLAPGRARRPDPPRSRRERRSWWRATSMRPRHGDRRAGALLRRLDARPRRVRRTRADVNADLRQLLGRRDVAMMGAGASITVPAGVDHDIREGTAPRSIQATANTDLDIESKFDTPPAKSSSFKACSSSRTRNIASASTSSATARGSSSSRRPSRRKSPPCSFSRT
ncbi:MAG: hypothetical protein MZV70_05600 [Desulfobacterales bacterium]|nr:hypothetical protein [Desulfobacterales bacterium]